MISSLLTSLSLNIMAYTAQKIVHYKMLHSNFSCCQRNITGNRLWSIPCDDLAPLKHIIIDLSKEKLKWQQSQQIV